MCDDRFLSSHPGVLNISATSYGVVDHRDAGSSPARCRSETHGFRTVDDLNHPLESLFLAPVKRGADGHPASPLPARTTWSPSTNSEICFRRDSLSAMVVPFESGRPAHRFDLTIRMSECSSCFLTI